MKHTVIVTTRPLDWMIDQLAEQFDVHVMDKGQSLADLPIAARSAAGIARFDGGRIDQALISALPQLRVISNFGAGYELVDVAAARERGIAVSFNSSGSPNAVADHAIGLLLAVTRRIVDAHRFVAQGDWLSSRYPLVDGFTGRRVGIYGMGRIGKAVAQRAAAFDMQVGYHNRRSLQASDFRYFPSLLELADWADYLVVCCPLTPETTASVNSEVLEKLGSSGVVVNVARGAVIDQQALIIALDAGMLGGAALDVMVKEPDHPQGLIGRANVVLTPHIAGSTLDGWRAASTQMLDNLAAYFATGRVLSPIPELP